jgi:hypothetical protein
MKGKLLYVMVEAHIQKLPINEICLIFSKVTYLRFKVNIQLSNISFFLQLKVFNLRFYFRIVKHQYWNRNMIIYQPIYALLFILIIFNFLPLHLVMFLYFVCAKVDRWPIDLVVNSFKLID